MKLKRGTITFFSAIIYLTLVTFALGITEAYRIQYLYAKQAEIGRLAVHNLQADYVVDIFEEYGLLFYDERLANGQYTVDKTYETGFKSKIEISYFQDFLYQEDKNREYHFPYFAVTDYSWRKERQKMDCPTLLAAKADALLFARDKLPFAVAGDWLEKLEVWKKNVKSEEWLKKKDKLLKELDGTERGILRLYEYLDGVKINENTHAATLENEGVNFFNVIFADQTKKIKEIESRSDIPERLKAEMIEQQFSAGEIVLEIMYFMERGMELVDEFWPMDEDLNDQERQEQIVAFYAAKAENYNQLKQMAEHFWQMTDSYRNSVRAVSEVVAGCQDSADKIKKFLAELETADLDLSMKQSIGRQMESLLQQYDMSNSISRIGNFAYLQQKLKENELTFWNLQKQISSLISEAQKLLNDYEAAQRNDEEWNELRPGELYDQANALLNAEKGIYFYFPLSYEGYREANGSETRAGLEQKQQQLEQSAISLETHLPMIEEQILNANHLPSSLLKANNQSVITQVPVFSEGLLDQIKQAFQQMADYIILNEYYFMVFSHFALLPEDDPAISGYIRSDHARTGELEYLLFGGEENVNRALMIAALFAARIAFNVVALLSDPAKMATVSSLATTIAGWWSLGAGTVILTGVIIGLWSALETTADIFMLFRGKRVPLIKTPATWYTSLAGALSGLAMETVEAAADVAEKALTQGIDDFQDLINQAVSDGNTDIRYYLENRVAEQVDQLKSELKNLDNHVRAAVSQGLYDHMQGKKQAKAATAEKLRELGLTNEQAEQVVSQIFDKLEASEQDFIQQKYTDKIEQAEAALNQGQAEIEKILKQVQKKGEQAIAGKLKEISEDLKKAGKAQIKRQKQYFKQKIDQKFSKKSPGPSQIKGKDWRDYIGFSYTDYLHLFLLAGVPDDVKWMRALDLIQQNQQQKVADFYFVNCERKFKICSTASYQPIFLPFGRKGWFAEWVNEKYQIEVVTVVSSDL
ncbi:hypothetical protein EII17_03530 [Clostridiales bacterium COT073_COT-073]|nr:hypothetical protein EII17_03530 [Clostridiales bacterium COT073_COT-073]